MRRPARYKRALPEHERDHICNSDVIGPANKRDEVADVYSNRQRASVFSHELLNVAYHTLQFIDEI
jgi:hypothetical protein